MAPALRIPVSVNMQQFEQGMDAMSKLGQQAAKQVVKEFVAVNVELGKMGVSAAATGAKMVIMSSTAQRAAMTLAANVAPILAVVAAYKAMNAITELAKEKMEEYVAVVEKAAKAGVSTDFFQRMGQAAEQSKVSVDNVSKAMEKLNVATAEKLGGSAFSKANQESFDAGNFEGNKGVTSFEQANTSEEKWRAVVQWITEAMDKGERLAALQVAEQFLPPEMMERLRANSDYLKDMLASADKLSTTKLIDAADLARAADLKNRMEEAEKILSEKWKPIQKDLISLGLTWHEGWVSMIEDLAGVVEQLQKVYAIIKSASQLLGKNSISDWAGSAMRVIGAGPMGMPAAVAGEAARMGMGIWNNVNTPDTTDVDPARQDLSNRLKIAGAAWRGGKQITPDPSATQIQSDVRGDKSKQKEDAAKEDAEAQTYFDREVDRVNRHIALLSADAAAVGLGVGAREQARVEQLLFNAAIKDGTPITEEQSEKLKALAKQAGDLANSTAVAKFHFQELMSASKELGSAISDAFKGMILQGKSFNEVLGQLLNRIASKSFDKLFDMFFGAPAGGGASPFLKLFGIGGNAEGTSNWRGGLSWVGEKGPELMNIPKGAQIYPNDVSRQMASSSTAITFAPQINAAPGTDEAMLTRVLAAARQQFISDVVPTVQEAVSRGQL